jgi:hypothetical protein
MTASQLRQHAPLHHEDRAKFGTAEWPEAYKNPAKFKVFRHFREIGNIRFRG